MVELKTEMTPLRLVLGKSKSVELMVQIKNDSEKKRFVSCDIVLNNELSFEKQGMSNARNIRLGEMLPGEKNLKYFQIYPRVNIEKGEQPIFVSVIEHFENNYDYILSKKTKQLTLVVE